MRKMGVLSLQIMLSAKDGGMETTYEKSGMGFACIFGGFRRT